MRGQLIAFVLLSLVACVHSEVDDFASATIGPDGGVLHLLDGTIAEIPRGALSHDTDVAIRRTWEVGSAASPAYELLPDGTTFSAPVVLTLAIGPGLSETGTELRARIAPAGTTAFNELPTEIVDGNYARAWTLQAGVIVVDTRHSCHGTGSCDDGNACTFNDSCVKGECRGTPYTCDDGNVCTNNVCDGAGGCRFPPNSAPCNDGNACTRNDTCSNGACSGTPFSCNDGNPCTDDACNGSGCTFTANTAPCDDGNACTRNDTCGGGVCSGIAYRCDDGNVCTDDVCDGAGGCRFLPNSAPCDDGNSCTTRDTCSAGACRAGALTCCTAGPETNCTNGVDDDCDGLIDAADPDCQQTCQPYETSCSNGVDDDCDGLVDFADPDCVLLECGADVCPYGFECFPDSYCHSHCEDGARSYDESDSDCGGADCPRCQAGLHCFSGFDCASGTCLNSICQ